MRKVLAISVFLFCLFGCASTQPELSGKYRTDNPNFIKKAWLVVMRGYDSFAAGTELVLKSDSSFRMETCANIITGKWSHTEGSLYLVYETNRWRNDSLHKNGFEGRWPQVKETPRAVLINGSSLVFYGALENRRSKNKVYYVLTK